MQADYLDLYLMHWPVTGNVGPTVQPPIADTWAAMEALVDKVGAAGCHHKLDRQENRGGRRGCNKGMQAVFLTAFAAPPPMLLLPLCCSSLYAAPPPMPLPPPLVADNVSILYFAVLLRILHNRTH